MTQLTRRVFRPITLIVALVLVMALPGAALAQTDEPEPRRDRPLTDRAHDERPDWDLDEVKRRILNQIERRLDALERLSDAVDENEHVTAPHAAHLQNDFREATRILENAAEAVKEAESFEELREIVPGVFQETLVFALQRPKTHLVLGSDTMVDVAEHFTAFAERLQEIIDRLAASGHDATEAQAALDEMVALIEDAAATAGPVAGNVIGLDPEDWPEPAQSVLEQGRSDLREARELLHQARGKAHEVISLIRELLSSD